VFSAIIYMRNVLGKIVNVNRLLTTELVNTSLLRVWYSLNEAMKTLDLMGLLSLLLLNPQSLT